MRNVWELLVVAGVVVLLALLILPAFENRGPRPRAPCMSNLTRIVQACYIYQEPNGGYFPAFWGGERFDSMKSLAMLYPTYIQDFNVFRCPLTKDRPEITVTVVSERDKRYAFGSVDTNKKCSYFYDERTNFRLTGGDQALAADADGQTWLNAQGKPPPYPSTGWTRQPRKPNHGSGQNVMYFDGHVKWSDTVYASRDPADNIFCPEVGWGPDTDAYVWDGVNARAAEIAK